MSAKLFNATPVSIGGKTFVPQTTDVTGRLDVVRRCNDANLLREALADTGLQKTVRTAIQRRLHALEKAS